MPSLANSSGSALAQKPLWETRSGQAYLGSESGWMREGSLLVKPRRSAPLQQHCFLVIWTVAGWPQTARSPAQPCPASPPLQQAPGEGSVPFSADHLQADTHGDSHCPACPPFGLLSLPRRLPTLLARAGGPRDHSLPTSFFACREGGERKKEEGTEGGGTRKSGSGSREERGGARCSGGLVEGSAGGGGG